MLCFVTQKLDICSKSERLIAKIAKELFARNDFLSRHLRFFAFFVCCCCFLQIEKSLMVDTRAYNRANRPRALALQLLQISVCRRR